LRTAGLRELVAPDGELVALFWSPIVVTNCRLVGQPP
jgi:hypothetical protein